MNKNIMNQNVLVTAIATFITLFCYTAQTQAQQCSVSLTGTYQLDPASGEGMYDAFVFDGAGKVNIRSLIDYKGDFLQIGDTIVVYPDKSIFTFLIKDDRTLVGINTWVKDQVFRRMENDTLIIPAQPRDQSYADQFYEYYVLTGRDAPSLSTYMRINMDSAIQIPMKKLCDEGFPKACLTMANALMMTSPELAAYLRGTSGENKKMAPNKEIYEYFVKAAELNELDAIAQMGAYVLMLGHKDAAKMIFEKGCELGHAGCCLSLAALEIESDE